MKKPRNLQLQHGKLFRQMLYKSMLSEILLLNIRQDADPEHGLGTPTFLVAVQMNTMKNTMNAAIRLFLRNCNIAG